MAMGENSKKGKSLGYALHIGYSKFAVDYFFAFSYHGHDVGTEGVNAASCLLIE